MKKDNNMPTTNLPSGILNDIRLIIENGCRQAYASVGQITIVTYWSIGKRIVEEEQGGQARAEYGKGLIKNLAEQLTIEYGAAFSKRNLDYYRKFYLSFKNLQIVNTCVHNLNWSHFIPNTIMIMNKQ